MLLASSIWPGLNVLLGRGAQYSKIIDFFYGKVGGNLDLAGGTFHDQVDLSGTQIGGLLRLGSESRGSAHWPGSPALTLRNANPTSPIRALLRN
jgi:hypothetical protein